MNRYAVVIVVFSLVFGSSLGCVEDANGACDICEECKEYRDNASIILVDRTTNLNASAKKQFVRGVDSFIRSQRVSGKIVMYEVRSADFDTRFIMQDCLKPLASVGEDEPAWKKSIEYIAKKINAESIYDYFAYKNSDKNKNTYEDDIDALVGRRSVVANIESYVNKDINETRSTALVSEFSRIYKDFSQGSDDLFILVYTDLQDTSLKKKLLDEKVEWEQLGIDKARHYAEIFPVRNPAKNVTVVFWGVGRSEVDKDSKLKAEEAAKFEKFWRSFVGTLVRPRHSEVNIYFRTDFPVEFFS
ncbi:hypothetical protein [Solidesulfovibrio sp.]